MLISLAHIMILCMSQHVWLMKVSTVLWLSDFKKEGKRNKWKDFLKPQSMKQSNYNFLPGDLKNIWTRDKSQLTHPTSTIMIIIMLIIISLPYMQLLLMVIHSFKTDYFQLYYFCFISLSTLHTQNDCCYCCHLHVPCLSKE